MVAVIFQFMHFQIHFFSLFVLARFQSKKRYDTKRNEQPILPCLLPITVPTSASKDTHHPGEETCVKEDEQCKRRYLDVRTKKWIKKYNNLLGKCDRFEQRAIYYRNQTWYYKNKLYGISELCGTSHLNSPPNDQNSDGYAHRFLFLLYSFCL